MRMFGRPGDQAGAPGHRERPVRTYCTASLCEPRREPSGGINAADMLTCEVWPADL